MPSGGRRIQPGQPFGLRPVRLVVGFRSQQHGTAQPRHGELIRRGRGQVDPELLAGPDAEGVDVSHQASDPDGAVRGLTAAVIGLRRAPQRPGSRRVRLVTRIGQHG
jgi:hypothetical protein